MTLSLRLNVVPVTGCNQDNTGWSANHPEIASCFDQTARGISKQWRLNVRAQYGLRTIFPC
jgi:hypothetical protein